MFKLRRSKDCLGLLSSELFDQDSFYPAFFADVKGTTRTIIVESPFIGQRRVRALYPVIESAAQRAVRVIINTGDPAEHDAVMERHALEAIRVLQALGITVLYTSNHHRKLAIIDDHILYEGSLNILSQSDSCEIMRRIDSETLVKEILDYLKIGNYLLSS